MSKIIELDEAYMLDCDECGRKSFFYIENFFELKTFECKFCRSEFYIEDGDLV